MQKIEEPNPRPKKQPKVVIRLPEFKPGDCLSIRLKNGQYAAALVLSADHSSREHAYNVIGVLDYLLPKKPTIDVFRKRKWLVLTHHSWEGEMDLDWYGSQGFRAVKARIEIVSQVKILGSDPKESNSYCGWSSIGEQVVFQRKWDAKAT
jgi:hypothetical protein